MEDLTFRLTNLLPVDARLECDNKERSLRYTNDGTNWNSRNVKVGKYDGLHLYSQAGAEALTAGMVGILQRAGVVRAPGRTPPTPGAGAGGQWEAVRPARGFRGNSRNYHTDFPEFVIPTQNRLLGNYQ